MAASVRGLLLCLLLATLAASRRFLPTLVASSRALLAENTFCLFATGELIFEERLTQLAPSAKLGGVGSFTTIGAQINTTSNDGTVDLQHLFGAVYYLSNDDKEKIVDVAYNRMTLSDVEVLLEDTKDTSDHIQCMCMDVGILPHAFPLPIYTQFPPDIDVKTYEDRMKKIGTPADYLSWLATLKPDDKNAPTPAYARPSSFVPPSIPPASGEQPTPQFEEFQMPKDKFCMFVANDLVFEENMQKTVASATTIGGAMLWDRYIALGGETLPNKSYPYKGFDRTWGVAYTFDQKEFQKIKLYGVRHSSFIAEVRTIVKEKYVTTCLTFDVGLTPAALPFDVFLANTLELQHYLKRLSTVGVPSGYVKAIEKLGKSFKVEQNEPRQIMCPMY